MLLLLKKGITYSWLKIKKKSYKLNLLVRKKIRQTQTGKHSAKVNDDLQNCQGHQRETEKLSDGGKGRMYETKCNVEFRTVF